MLKFERLENNSYPLPKYETEGSAAFDLYACLRRKCICVEANQQKMEFRLHGIMRLASVRQDLIPVDKTIDCQLVIHPGETILVPLGFKTEFSSEYVLLLFMRSGISLSGLRLANGVGVIDSDYRGELFAAIYNPTQKEITIVDGQKVVQGLITNALRPKIVELNVNETKRGEGGFGSTSVSPS